MRNWNYVSELFELIKAEKVIRKSIDTYNINRKQRDYLFKQLEIINEKKETLQFKIKLNERLKTNEKSRQNFWK